MITFSNIVSIFFGSMVGTFLGRFVFNIYYKRKNK